MCSAMSVAVANLKKQGTYAGNDAIVAFARLHKVVVVIHQLNSPCLQVSVTITSSCYFILFPNTTHQVV